MKLLLDIGNSSINWAVEENEQLITTGAFSYNKNNVEQDLQTKLSHLQKPLQVLVANVAGDIVFNDVSKWVTAQWQLVCWRPNVGKNFNKLKNSYRDTQEMGIDRWLVMVAAWEKHQSALCLVGCGTALTIDAIDAEGNHLGGYIIPGIELMQQSLIAKAECINSPVEKHALVEYAENTQSAINNGAFFVTVAAIDRAFVNLTAELKSPPKCIISGGMAASIKPLLEENFEHESDLVLSGLLTVYKASS